MKRTRRLYVNCGLFMIVAGTLATKAQYPSQLVGMSGVGLVSFPATAAGSSTTQTVQVNVTNSGRPILINSITVPQSLGGKQEFVVGMVSGCVIDGKTSIPSGSICSFPVTFTPAYAGIRNQQLLVDVSAALGDAPGTDFATFGLSGIGLAPLAVVAPGNATLLQAGVTTSYQYTYASGMAVDGAGNAYAALPRSQTVVKIDKDTAAVSTIAGLGTVSYPQAVAVDAAGDLFIAYANVVVEKVSGLGGLYPFISEENGYGGYFGFTGDGGPAYAASLATAEGLAIDPSGNLFVADRDNECIRRVDAKTQIITTYAGVGITSGGSFSGDGGAATSAKLNSPYGLAIDAAGNLYIADYGNNRIRKVTASTGIITTVAGNGTAGYRGDGGPATAAELNGPIALSLDPAGNLYIGDSNNFVVRKIDAATNTIYTVAGGGNTTLTAAGQTLPATGVAMALPSGLAVDPLGSLFVSNSANSQIFKIAPTAGSIAFPHQTLLNAADTADNPLPFYLSNDGTQPFAVTVPSSGPNPVLTSGFSVDASSPCQPLLAGGTAQIIAPGGSCVYDLDFTPPMLGANTGTLTVTDTAPTATQTINLSGTGGTASATTLSLALQTSSGLTYTSNDTLTATIAHTSVGATSPINGTVTFAADGNPLSGGSNIPATNGVATFNFTQLLQGGSHTLTAAFTPANSSGLDPSTASIAVLVSPAAPAFATLNVDNHVYDGSPHGVTATANPSSLTTTIYYEPIGAINQYTATPPTLPGVYNVQIAINGTADYTTIATFVLLHIYALPATVTINSLAVSYGTAVPAPTVTTTPSGLATTVYYNGSTTAPTAVGAYIMAANVTTPGYAGSADATLEIYSPTMPTSTWIVNQDSTVSHLSSAGAVSSTAGSASGTSTLGGIAIDSAGDAWAVTNANSQVVEVSSSGVMLGTYTGGGLAAPVSIAIDGLGKPWVVNSGNSVTVLSTSGSALNSTGYLANSLGEASPLSTPSGIAIDATGSVWITNAGDSSVTRVFGAAAPVISPTVIGVVGSSLGKRP